ncbi:hypothetical protein ABZ442_17570 [Streptomyces triculaminicus]|uniref:hypothetical protein n=1 Tax=Streptomyces triculaminicus TaxID=2816232 RepID=UPI0034038B9F
MRTKIIHGLAAAALLAVPLRPPAPPRGPKGAVQDFTVHPPDLGQFLGYASIEWASC